MIKYDTGKIFRTPDGLQNETVVVLETSCRLVSKKVFEFTK